MKVKICGIQTLEAARASIDAGADFLGFNFVPISQRYINPEIAKKICSRLRLSNIKIVGVFQNEKMDVVNKLINYLKLDYVQLHGDESPKYIGSIQEAGIIKTFSLPFDFNVEETIKKMKNYDVDYLLLDREEQGRGKVLNLNKVRELTLIFPIILAGGLTIDNIQKTIGIVEPFAVDVAGGVESDGIKDGFKIKEFINRIHFHGLIHESK